MKLDPALHWLTHGTFSDRDGRTVKSYDDVVLHVDAACVSEGSVSADRIPAGSVGTVTFVTGEEPVLLQLECDLPGGFAFADNYPASQVSLHQTAEQKRIHAPN
jgi:hypothetical protein